MFDNCTYISSYKTVNGQNYSVRNVHAHALTNSPHKQPAQVIPLAGLPHSYTTFAAHLSMPTTQPHHHSHCAAAALFTAINFASAHKNKPRARALSFS